jgi:hypothetical protein
LGWDRTIPGHQPKFSHFKENVSTGEGCTLGVPWAPLGEPMNPQGAQEGGIWRVRIQDEICWGVKGAKDLIVIEVAVGFF